MGVGGFLFLLIFLVVDMLIIIFILVNVDRVKNIICVFNILKFWIYFLKNIYVINVVYENLDVFVGMRVRVDSFIY